MAKLIKFDLPINGVKIKNLEELRENLTDEIVALARSGQLARWLMTRQLADEAARVQAAVANEADDTALCLALCITFDVDVFPEDIAAIFGSPGEAGTKLGEGSAQMKLQVAQKILRGVLKKVTHEQFAELEKELGDIEGQLGLLDVECYRDLGNGTDVECYRDLGNGTVLDITTGLQWMRCALGQDWDGQTCIGEPITITGNDLANEVATFNRKGGFAGQTDWRVPEIDELKSLICLRNKSPNSPAIDQRAFPNTPTAWFWSSSPYAGYSGYAWVVYFGDGNVSSGGKGFAAHVRLVRGGQ